MGSAKWEDESQNLLCDDMDKKVNVDPVPQKYLQSMKQKNNSFFLLLDKWISKMCNYFKMPNFDDKDNLTLSLMQGCKFSNILNI